MISAGIDLGGTDIKVLLFKGGKILAKEKAPGGFEQNRVAEELLEETIKRAGIGREEVGRTGVTGSGTKYAPP